MTRKAGLALLLVLPLLASGAHAQSAPFEQQGGAALAGAAPLGLTGVQALIGQELPSLARAPLVCGAPRPDGAKACRVARRYGQYVIDDPAPLTAKVRLDRLTLIVRGQIVEAVALETSPDNFHAVTHLLTTRLGAPARTKSARVRLSARFQPRVTMTWRADGVVVSLTDPTPHQTLSVLIGHDDAAAKTASGA